MKEFFVDLHIHIGRADNGAPVKITAARDLTFANICFEATKRKGIHVIGVVDCASPPVQEDIRRMIQQGELIPLKQGGLRYQDQSTVFLGAEVEVNAGDGVAHFLCYFPYLEQMEQFSTVAAHYIKNINLSSQKARLDLEGLWRIVNDLGGVVIPAHAFTPHKGLYGNCTHSLTTVLSPEAIASIPAIELGLSSDSQLADLISELGDKTFLTNSDAHSLPKIGREYNLIQMVEPNFKELLMALRRQEGRQVVRNYGLNPVLGKYHRTYCHGCDRPVEVAPPMDYCPGCQGQDITLGVLDRIYQVKDRDRVKHPDHRPAYRYQVPLQFLPKLGPKTIEKLLKHFGTEMQVLHYADLDEIAQVTNPTIAHLIDLSRQGTLELGAGGGGHYGKVLG